ncbi:inner membrane protein [Serratia entomophila]|uniref:MarC family NAAT transporter n=1 Tax=Serratia entomophila TaxID=42906 RepID=UPI00217A19E6|nr:MarC family NAAT transporter [Serratia entomophila]CAI1707858.1 inner membrane protein [Serratia entomophila]CAI2925066.1 inner membrane protein [Serratia entomophila]
MTSILQLFQAIGLGLVLLLPLANPLTTVALLLGLSGNIGFRMLFPQQNADETPEVESKTHELRQKTSTNIAFVPLAMPSTAGPGTIAMIISSASSVKENTLGFAHWVLLVAPVAIFLSVAVILWVCLRSSGAIMRLVGKSGIEAISRLMGFLLVCMGVQFIINGVLEIIATYTPGAA